MLNINKKKRLIVSVFVAVAVILPAVTFAVGNLAKTNETFADAAEAAANSNFTDDKLWRCVVFSYINRGKAAGLDDSAYDRPSDEDFNTALSSDQLKQIKNFMCTRWIVVDTTNWTGLSQLTEVTTATISAQSNMESFKPSSYFQNLKNLYLNNDVNLTTLDLGGATKLEQLHVVPVTGGTSKLSSVQNLSSATSLVRFNANYSKLTSLDFSNQSSLDEINFASNQLTYIKMPNTCNVTALNVRDNSSLDNIVNLGRCSKLKSLAIINDRFGNGQLDISNNTQLEALKAHGNDGLTVVDITFNKNLYNIQLDPEDYVYARVQPTVGSNNNLIYNYGDYSFVYETGSWSGNNAVFRGDNNNYSGNSSNKKLTVNNYGNLPFVRNSNKVEFDGKYKYVEVTQATSAVNDNLIDNGEVDDFVNNTYRVIVAQPDTNEYTLSFDVTSVEEQTCETQAGASSCSVTIPNTIPRKTGFTFKGWAENAGSSTVAYRPNANVTLTSDKTLYAVWEEDAPQMVTYTLSFSTGQGASTVSPTTCDAEQGSTCPALIPGTTPTRNGYVFVGWANSNTATTPTYQPGGNVTLNGDKTIYALWKATLTFDSQGGSSVTAQTCVTGQSSCGVTIPGTEPTKSGYTFKGWADSAGATTAAYQPGASMTLNGNKTVYAVWQQNTPGTVTYTLTFDSKQGSSVEPKSCSTTAGSTCTVQIPGDPTRTDYTFKGWAETDGGAVKYNPGGGADVTLNSNKTLYAVWEFRNDDTTDAKTFTLSFDTRGGSRVEPKTCTTNQSSPDSCEVTIPVRIPELDGYIFKGWLSGDEQGVVLLQPGTKVILTEDKTVYAVWDENTDSTEKTFTVEFDSQGGTPVDPESCTGQSSCKVRIPEEAPTYEKHVFKGWASTPDGEPEVFPGDEININSNITLYAIWAEADGSGVITPNTGAMTDENSGATSMYLIVGAILAMAFPVYLGVKRTKKIGFTKH